MPILMYLFTLRYRQNAVKIYLDRIKIDNDTNY